MSFALLMLRSQLLTTLPYPKSDFTGQTIIVTGSNSGLGLEASRHLVRLGARVILAVRSKARGDAAAKDILQSTSVDSCQVAVWLLDLSSQNSVKNFAEKVRSLDRLDAFIQNAAMDDCSNFRTTEDGFEQNIAVNVINPVLLGLMVLPKLRQTAAKYGTMGRLSFIGSALLQLAKFEERHVSQNQLFDALNDEKTSHMEDRYRVSKLLLLYAIRELANEMPVSENSPVLINYVTPGLCDTSIVQKSDRSERQSLLKSAAMALLARSAEMGSRTLVDAVKPDIEKSLHGAYLRDCQVFPTGPLVDSEEGREVQARFFFELREVLEEMQPGVTEPLVDGRKDSVFGLSGGDRRD